MQRLLTTTLAAAGTLPGRDAAPSRVLATACLHIDVDAEPGSGGSRLAALLHCLHCLLRAGGRRPGGRLDLALHDLQGHRLLELRDARFAIDLRLQPGTYHLSTLQCGARRQYTVALDPGAVCTLRLQRSAGCT
jgi:hypothetical protein